MLSNFRSMAAASLCHGTDDRRTPETELLIAVLIHTLYPDKTSLPDVQTSFVYALIILLRSRQLRPEQRPLVATDPTECLTTAVRIACLNFTDGDLKGKQRIVTRPSNKLRDAELFIMRVSQWKTWVQDEDSEQFQQMTKEAGYFSGSPVNEDLP